MCLCVCVCIHVIRAGEHTICLTVLFAFYARIPSHTHARAIQGGEGGFLLARYSITYIGMQMHLNRDEEKNTHTQL